MPPDSYFDTASERQPLFWACAVRVQLGRWEPLVAKHALQTLAPNLRPPPDPPIVMAEHEYWDGERERHLLLIAARNLLLSLGLLDNPPVVDSNMRSELIEARDLNEHWLENMGIFNVHPRPREPKYRSGKEFAERNPRSGPYCWWAWSLNQGPLVTPNVPAATVHNLCDQVIDAVISDDSAIAGYVPRTYPSPWHPRANSSDPWWPNAGFFR